MCGAGEERLFTDYIYYYIYYVFIIYRPAVKRSLSSQTGLLESLDAHPFSVLPSPAYILLCPCPTRITLGRKQDVHKIWYIPPRSSGPSNQLHLYVFALNPVPFCTRHHSNTFHQMPTPPVPVLDCSFSRDLHFPPNAGFLCIA